MQLRLDSTDPLERVLAVLGSLYDVEILAVDGAVDTESAPEARTTADTARPVPAGKAVGRKHTPSTRASRRAPAAKPDPVAVRTWARANGHDVRDRGRVPAAILDAYAAAGSPTV